MRYIMIDNTSGYIFGDTSNAPGFRIDCAERACTWLDESIGEFNRTYEVVCRLASNETGYRVYETTPDFPAINNGRDDELIEMVERDCVWGCCIRVHKD